MSPHGLTLFSLILLLATPALLLADTESSAITTDTADVAAYYFHGDTRCRTCLLLEEMTVCAVRDSFPDLLDDGTLSLDVVNFQEDGNEHFADDFELDHQSVVLVVFENGKIRRWKNLKRIWELYDKPQEFNAYIVDETNVFLDETHEEPGGD